MNKLSHKNGPGCPLCLEKLDECHPDLKLLFQKIKNLDSQAHVAWGYRSDDEQRAVYIAGRSKARPGDSAHNVKRDGKPFSLAIDIFFQDNLGNPDWMIERYQILHEGLILMMKKEVELDMTSSSKKKQKIGYFFFGQRFEWGGNFLRMSGDFGHYQLLNWKNLRDDYAKEIKDQL